MRSGNIAPLSQMAWLDGARARAWMLVLAATTWPLAGLWILLSRHGLDLNGRPIGTDFIEFWCAARLVLNGAGTAAPYDHRLLAALQTATFSGADVGYTPFPYPPIFLFVCLPFGALPYTAGLAAWLAATGAAYVAALRHWLDSLPNRSLVLLVYPGVLVNAACGQNGFLTTALFGAGALLLAKRPLLAGACLGALVVKPHLGVLIPVALVAARGWRTIAGAAATVLALVTVSALAFGLEPWRQFLDSMPFVSAMVTRGALEPGKVQSAFAAAKVLGADNAAAFGLQAVFSVCAGVSLFLLGRRTGLSPALGAALVSATLVTSPYLLSYDLMLAAIPMAWLFAEGRRTGFLPWEKAALLAGFVLPMVCLALVSARIPIAPLVLAGLYAAVFRRAWRTSPADRRETARGTRVGRGSLDQAVGRQSRSRLSVNNSPPLTASR
ncbi:MAG TPA: glycosyltransferase family 87 protein [Phenylobacterium sp.]|uniref:glycosyltransferase family 87 protein n=1 Tax=Phenylobacterium sp. TaxID=1871053 RepID=UPI002B4A9A2F|nr:glycosyltransferase family 87 protein [Phenylobacterium sp.]HKR88614.1 glycosyltransferase family 87 protein [Phenylobacterium sp.]